MDRKNFRIKTAEYGSAEYEGLRSLWSEVFGDTPDYVDAFYKNFGSSIRGYVVTDEDGRVCSALTCHLCGTYENMPVYVSYAICTREDMRGQGLAAMLISFVRDNVTEAGGISIVSPAEPSLVSYYADLGYEPHFFTAVRAVMSPEFDFEDYDDFDEFDLDIEGADSAPVRAELDMQRLPAEKYNIYREAFLAGQPHIEPGSDMLQLIESESMNGRGLYSINRGDAICAIGSADPVSVMVTELILNPVLKELSLDIDTEIASMIAKHFGSAEAVYRTPGFGECQGLICGLPYKDEEQDEEYEMYYEKPYYGFPVD
ncbi:MAG: GNAT family N-acetyltransferase [Mogibacterium sp.]|nr:GNAT family N-acetyltransferase [Mogibacterium sp.]